MSARDLAWMTDRPIAHRGLFTRSAERPENSLPAFAAAVEAGVGIELDVRLSADHVAMVFHDRTTERMTGRLGFTEEMTRAELSALRLKGGAASIPSLAEAVELVDGRVPVFIEMKSSSRRGAMADAVRSALGEQRRDRIAVMSFDPLPLIHFRRRMPQMPRGLVMACWKVAAASAWMTTSPAFHRWAAWRCRPNFYAVHAHCLPTPLTRGARKSGKPVLAWTLSDPADVKTARAHADALIFEEPAGLVVASKL